MTTTKERDFSIELGRLRQKHVDERDITSEEMIRVLQSHLHEEQQLLESKKRAERSY